MDKGFAPNEIVQVVVRPEDIQVVPAIQGQLTGVVENVIFKGVHYEMHVRQAGYEWMIHSTQVAAGGRAYRHEHRPGRDPHHAQNGGLSG